MRNIPKILHCIWVGGGDITKAKDLKAIESWLVTQPDYEVWIWWDHSHMFNLNGVRQALGLPDEQSLRQAYEGKIDLGPLETGQGQDFRSFDLLRQVLKHSDRIPAGLSEFCYGFSEFVEAHYPAFYQTHSNGEGIPSFADLCGPGTSYPKERDFLLALYLMELANMAMDPLRKLAQDHPWKLFLMDVAELDGFLEWRNNARYHSELGQRGVFPAAASDVLRYEILYNCGGIYLDVDLQLTDSLGQLRVEDNLALCAFEDFFGRTRDVESQAYHLGSAKTHKQKCFYAMNNIIATHEKSDFVSLLREAIRIGYDRMDNDPAGPLRAYWQHAPNKATIDLTGPNLVREVQYQISLGVQQTDIPERCVSRVAAALVNAGVSSTSQVRGDVEARAKAAEGLVENFPRLASVWPDDRPEYFAFWNWVWSHTYFPMDKVNWRNEATAKSDTKAAAKQ